MADNDNEYINTDYDSAVKENPWVDAVKDWG